MVPVYFEAAAVIVALVLLGQVLELRAREKTGGAIRALLDLAPKTARRSMPTAARRESRSTRSRSATALRVRPGEKVPVDGTVVEGRARSTSRWSPASRSRSRKPRATRVTGGTLNGTGSFLMRAERVGAETMLAQIVEMVAEAQRTRAPIQRLADTRRRPTSCRP